MGEQTDYDLMSFGENEGPMPFDDCPMHEGIECEKPCPCRCNDCDYDEEECEHEGDTECKHCGADLSQVE
jgi:hypothetical protein